MVFIFQPGGIFGATTSQASGGLFGSTQPQQPATSGFGTSTGGFGGFGQQNTQQQSGGLFGANKPATGFGATSTSTGIGFGNTQLGGASAFNKPATSGTGFSFGGTGTTGFGQTNTGGGLFGNKPTGFGTQTNTLGGGTGFGATNNTLGGTTGFGSGGGLFSGQQKPGGLGTGLGTGFGTGTTGFGGLGGNTLGGSTLGSASAPQLGAGADAAVAAQQQQIQQQLLALTHSPYGDSPLLKNLKQDDQKREEATKPTNPAAQKAVLSTTSQYKVSPRPTAKIKPRPLQNIVSGRKSELFEGLAEEDDSTFGSVTLVPRKSIKRLVLRGGALDDSAHASPNQSFSQLDADLVSPMPSHAATRQNSNESVRHNDSMHHNGDRSILNGDAETSILQVT